MDKCHHGRCIHVNSSGGSCIGPGGAKPHQESSIRVFQGNMFSSHNCFLSIYHSCIRYSSKITLPVAGFRLCAA